jgi:8-oxo-dGTP pyrophosphatase MutT (NUDIX family)
MQKPELLGSDPVYDGKLITVHRDRQRQGDQTVEREVVDHPDSVAIVAVNDRDEVLLVRQYRHPVGDFLWKLPAGLLDEPDEKPLEAAKRALSEEAGVRAARWEHLVALHPSPGMTSENVDIYLAGDLDEVKGGAHPDDDEHLERAWVPLPEALQRVRSGDINNGLVVAGLLAARTWPAR